MKLIARGLVFLAFVAVYSTTLAFANSADPESCKFTRAVYKPHPSYSSYFNRKNPDIYFELTMFVRTASESRRIAEMIPDDEKSSLYYLFIVRRHGTQERLSSLRMKKECIGGYDYPMCWFSADVKNPSKPLPKLADIKLNKDFFPFTGKSAPYAIILPNTQRAMHRSFHSPGRITLLDNDDAHKYIDYTYFVKVEPDFGGADVWIFDRCDKEDHVEPEK